MVLITTELGFVSKHVSMDTNKENAVNYLTRNHSSAEEYYYYEDSYAVNNYMKGF